MKTYLFIGGKQHTKTFEIADDRDVFYFADIGTREQEEYRKVTMTDDSGLSFQVFAHNSLSEDSMLTLYSNFLNPTEPAQQDNLAAFLKKLNIKQTMILEPYQREWIDRAKKET